jgi:hypothetical protein
MSLANAKQRFGNCLANLNELLEQNILKVDDNENVVINFLDEQMKDFTDISMKRASAGTLGGIAKAKQMPSKCQANANISEQSIAEGKGDTSLMSDYEFIISNYHTLCPKMSKVEKLTDKREGFINARYGEYGMEKITQVLRMAGESNFLNGVNDRAWKADIEWLMRPENFVKVMEGKYKNKEPKEVKLAV